MNQKYLMGMAAEGGQAVVFEAKASNVAAFISQNRMAPELLICTLDYKMFLTARRGMIDMCPDRKFLVQELLPVLVPMQTGQVQDMPLVLVPRESVQDEECPQPDWNYLRWDGYDNEKFEKIMDGSVLLNYEFLGETIPMELRIGRDGTLERVLMFDDAADPYQLHNLAPEEHPALFAALCRELAVLLRDNDDVWFREGVLSDVVPYDTNN